ncbi:MAG: APH(3') family aminoglycoside O-phosphotransferase [Vicinamibacterales bacterium]
MHIPPAVRAFVEGAECDPVHIGKSAASVFRLRSHVGTLFLKMAMVTDRDGLEAEAERLRWLAGRLSVPNVVSFAKDDGREYLLVTSVPGVNGIEAGREHPAGVTTGLAQALRMLHAQPIDACPFDQTVAAQIERARQRVVAGVVDEADFDEERLGRTAQALLTDVEAWRPVDEARSLTHGDPCLPNVMFNDGQFAGFVDCGRVGVADPYQDLALAARSIASNLGREWVGLFFMQYGLSAPDERKLAFYRLLDEFF